MIGISPLLFQSGQPIKYVKLALKFSSCVGNRIGLAPLQIRALFGEVIDLACRVDFGLGAVLGQQHEVGISGADRLLQLELLVDADVVFVRLGQFGFISLLARLDGFLLGIELGPHHVQRPGVVIVSFLLGVCDDGGLVGIGLGPGQLFSGQTCGGFALLIHRGQLGLDGFHLHPGVVFSALDGVVLMSLDALVGIGGFVGLVLGADEGFTLYAQHFLPLVV